MHKKARDNVREIKTEEGDSCESPSSFKAVEELLLLLGGLLGRGFLCCFFLSCHGESPPHQVAHIARSRAKNF
jgi:hypothetical protein